MSEDINKTSARQERLMIDIWNAVEGSANTEGDLASLVEVVGALEFVKLKIVAEMS